MILNFLVNTLVYYISCLDGLTNVRHSMCIALCIQLSQCYAFSFHSTMHSAFIVLCTLPCTFEWVCPTYPSVPIPRIRVGLSHVLVCSRFGKKSPSTLNREAFLILFPAHIFADRPG